MKIDAIKLAIAVAAVFAIAWIVCSLFVIWLPSAMMQMAGHMVHADFGHMGWQLTLGGFIFALTAWSIGAGLIAGLTAAVYNRLVG